MRLALTFLLLTLPATAQLCPKLQALTQTPEVAAAHWGYSITTLTGTPVCSLNDAQLFRPASNAKLFTTAAALTLLGPSHTYTTVVTGNLTGDTITGDLTLLGAGDPNLDSNDLPYTLHPVPHPLHDLEDLARQLQQLGIRHITGDLLGDDTLFPYEPYPASWSHDDLIYGYGAPISALTITDNQLKLTITPTAVTLEQNGIPYYTILNQLRVTPAKSPTDIHIERSSRTLRLTGTIASDSPPDIEQIAIDDPAAYAAQLFRATLLTHGITVAGTARPQHRYPGTPNVSGAPSHSVSSSEVGLLPTPSPDSSEELVGAPGQTVSPSDLGVLPLNPCPPSTPILATHTSAPMSQDIRFTLKASQNLHAELTLHALTCGTSTALATQGVRTFLTQIGIPKTDFIFYDGSGLSDHDLVTPRATTRLLAWAATQPWFASWKAALPLGGTDGTLQHRFTTTLKGKISAKTGTLGESRALSGYLQASSGQTLIFSILTDNHYPNTPTDRLTTDKMVELIAAEN